jgi:hypothetical protein
LRGCVEAQGGVNTVQGDEVRNVVEVGFGAIVDDEAGHYRFDPEAERRSRKR